MSLSKSSSLTLSIAARFVGYPPFLDAKANLFVWWLRRVQKLANGLEDCLDSFVVRGHSTFKFLKFACQFFVCGQQLAQPYKRTHDVDAGLDGTLTFQNIGQHDRPVFGESARLDGREFQSPKVVTICDHLLFFLAGKSKHEIVRKATEISSDCLIQDLGCYAIKGGEIGVEDDTMPAHEQDQRSDAFNGYDRVGVFHRPGSPSMRMADALRNLLRPAALFEERVKAQSDDPMAMKHCLAEQGAGTEWDAEVAAKSKDTKHLLTGIRSHPLCGM